MKKIIAKQNGLIGPIQNVTITVKGGDSFFIERDKYEDTFLMWDMLKVGDKIEVDSTKLPLRIRQFKSK
jgi:hypothetical protein